MVTHDYDSSRRGRDRSASINAQRLHEELDRGTLGAGGMLGAALLVLIAYMLLVAPTT